MNLQQLIQQSEPIIIDVREPFEFEMGHVDGARNIPLGHIPGHIDEFRSLEKSIIFYCRSGMRSGQAVAFLGGLGVHDIYNGGGLDDMIHLIKTSA
ncbi:MAG: rhodanese-like domain-containing protein [Saprospiraceae bacterium]|nr:rhodanese-like domain-containing protein [Saprospiraceae bacterium]